MSLLDWFSGAGGNGLLGMSQNPARGILNPQIQAEDLPPLNQPQPAPQPQAQGFFSTLQSNPGLSNALFRLSGALADSASRGENTGIGLGRGFAAFGEGLQQGNQLALDNQLRSKQLNLQTQSLARQNRLTDAQVKKLEAQAKQDEQYGINDSTWQGTVAMAYAKARNPNTPEDQRRNAQAVIDVFESQKGAYNPVTGTFDYNQINRTGPSPLPAVAGPASAPAPINPGGFTGAIMQAESNGRRYGPDGKLLESPKGALGEMQVMPATARDPGYGVAPARDNSPEELARVGREYAAAMQARYPGRPDLAAAAYNGGPGRMDAALASGTGLSGMPRESRDYSATVVTNMGGNPYANTPKTQAAAAEEAAKASVQLKADDAKYQQEKAQGKNKAEAAFLTTMQGFEDYKAKLGEAQGQVGPGTTGFIGSALKMVPGTSAADLNSNLETLRANEFLGNLAQLKAASPTGSSGLGATTEAEGRKVESKRQSLYQSTSQAQLERNLAGLGKQIDESRRAIEEAYKKEYGSLPGSNRVKTYNPKTGRLE